MIIDDDRRAEALMRSCLDDLAELDAPYRFVVGSVFVPRDAPERTLVVADTDGVTVTFDDGSSRPVLGRRGLRALVPHTGTCTGCGTVLGRFLVCLGCGNPS